jgi:hypothetical protein
MRFKEGLYLPVFTYTAQELEAINLGIQGNEAEMGWSDTETRTFYVVDFIAPNNDVPKTSYISIGGESFCIDMDCKTLKEKIARLKKEE